MPIKQAESTIFEIPEIEFDPEKIHQQILQDWDWFHIYPTLYPRQIEASLSEAKYRLFWGAKWWWKSHWLRSEAIRECMSWPGVQWLILRRTRPEVWENTIKYLLKEIPEYFTDEAWIKTRIYQYNDKTSTMTFFNWSTIKFWYCRNLKEVLQYQWIQYDFIWIEELTHWTFEEWKILMWCLRIYEAWVTPNFFATTNPWWKWHEWVKRLWIDKKYEEWEIPEEYAFIPAAVFDNEFIMKHQPEYIRDLQSLPDKLRRQFLEWDWDVFEWQYFKEFRRELHVVENMIPNIWIKKRIVAFDYWYAAQSGVYWLAQTNQWKVYCYRELYVKEHTYKQLWRKIKALTTSKEKIWTYICDPAIYNKRNDSTASTAKQDFNDVWIKLTPWKNSRIDWWSRMREYLQPFEDPNSWEIQAQLSITENCENLIRTTPLMLHDQRNLEDLDTTLEDHAVDWLRYGLMELWVAKKWFSDIKDLTKKMNKKVSTKGSELWRKRNKKNLLNMDF